jgi:hypothetical protein
LARERKENNIKDQWHKMYENVTSMIPEESESETPLLDIVLAYV